MQTWFKITSRRLSGVNDNAGSFLAPAVSLTPLVPKSGDFIAEYLRKFDTLCKKAFTR
jgi:hypothetical protein